MDKLDRVLLRQLQINARVTNRELAEAAHVVPSTSLARVRALREQQVVTGFHADVDLVAIGRGVQALAAVRIRPPSRSVLEDFRSWILKLPEVIGVFVTSGSSDFLVHVAVPSSGDLYAFVIDRLTQRPEVADVQTSLVYEHLQNRIIDPVDD